VPDHLKLTFRVVDDKHKKVAEGKDLEALKESLRGKVQETLSRWRTMISSSLALTLWSFGELPQSTARSAAGSASR
jgi:ATP-dependent helicase HrpA